MDKDRLEQLLEVYTLEEICLSIGLEPVDVLRILEEQGYLDNLELLEPL